MLALLPMVLAAQQNLPRVVVLPLENRAGEQYEYDVETITDLLATFMNETQRLNVIDRQVIDGEAAARGWQARDWADNAKTAEMGRVLNAQYIVRGTVSRMGDNLLVSARILDIATAELRSSTNTQLEHMNEAYVKMNGMAQLLIYYLPTQIAQPLEVSAQPEQAAQPPEAPETAVPTTGTLVIRTITAGTVEITGPDVNHTAQLPAGGSLRLEKVNAGSYRVLMSYEDGKTEEKQVKVKPSKTATLKFNYPIGHLNSMGVSAGLGMGLPSFFNYGATIWGTYAPWSGSFFELGMDIGGSFDSLQKKYFSLHPFIRYACFVPFSKTSVSGGGWYAGAGAGFFFASYSQWDDYYLRNNLNFYNYIEDYDLYYHYTNAAFTVNVFTGFVFRGGFTISAASFYSVHEEKMPRISGILGPIGGTLTIGYSYRFKTKEK